MSGQYVQIISRALVPLPGRQDITLGAAAGGLTVPGNAQIATARVEGGQIRFTLDGTVPTATVGMQLEIGDVLDLDDRTELLAFQMIRTGAAATLHVEYFGSV